MVLHLGEVINFDLFKRASGEAELIEYNHPQPQIIAQKLSNSKIEIKISPLN